MSLGGWYVIGPGTSPGGIPTPTAAFAKPDRRRPSPTRARPQALLDTDTWATYTSDRYGYSIRYPADWVPDPADHDWTIDEAADYGSTGHERFRHPDDDVGVSTWAYDPGPDVSLETTADLVAWAEDFCRLADSTPCDGIADRAVPLCREVADCHAGGARPVQQRHLRVRPRVRRRRPDAHRRGLAARRAREHAALRWVAGSCWRRTCRRSTAAGTPGSSRRRLRRRPRRSLRRREPLPSPTNPTT